MSKLTVTKFNKRSPFTNKVKELHDIKLAHKEVLQKNHAGKPIEKQKQLLRNANKLSKNTPEPRDIKIIHREVIQERGVENQNKMQNESEDKLINNSTNKANYSQEAIIVHEDLSYKIEKPNLDQLLNKERSITNNARVPQDIIIVHEEVTQKSSLEKESQEQLLKNVSTAINNNRVSQEIIIVHEEASLKSNYEEQKEKQKELLDKVNRKTAEYQANKPSSGVFTEVVTHGAFTPKTVTKDTTKLESATIIKSNGMNGSKTLLGYPSSANDLALDAKSDLESDPNISFEVKGKVIEKLFFLVSMVQHVYESKVRIMTEFEKYKETHFRNELRREKEHSEQLYKLNMNFQNEVIQSIQRLKSELDISRTVSKKVDDDHTSTKMKSSSVDFNTSDDAQDLDSIDKTHSTDDLIEQSECLPDANEDDKVNQHD